MDFDKELAEEGDSLDDEAMEEAMDEVLKPKLNGSNTGGTGEVFVHWRVAKKKQKKGRKAKKRMMILSNMRLKRSLTM